MITGLRSLIELLLVPMDLLPDSLALLIVSVVTGVVALLVVGWSTDQRALAHARDQMTASIYELRLFLDMPRRVLITQWRLLGWSARYVLVTMPALLILAGPFLLGYLHLATRWELDPLPTDEPVLVRVELDPTADPGSFTLDGSDLPLSAPPFFLTDERALYLRTEAPGLGAPELRFVLGGSRYSKRIVTDGSLPTVSPERLAGIAGLWALGDEDALPGDGPVRAIRIEYPERRAPWFGLAWPWWLWWLVISTAAALGLRKPLGIVI